MKEAANSGRFTLCLLGFQNLPHHKASLGLGSLLPWLQVSNPTAGFISLWLQKQRPWRQVWGNSSFKMPQIWSATLVSEHLQNFIEISACLNVNVLKIWFLVTAGWQHNRKGDFPMFARPVGLGQSPIKSSHEGSRKRWANRWNTYWQQETLFFLWKILPPELRTVHSKGSQSSYSRYKSS